MRSLLLLRYYKPQATNFLKNMIFSIIKVIFIAVINFSFSGKITGAVFRHNVSFELSDLI